MKTTTQNTTTQNSFSRIGLVVLFVLFLLSSVGMVGQNVQDAASTVTFEVSLASSDETVSTTQTATTTNTTTNQVNFQLTAKNKWFSLVLLQTVC